jgi:hypothetical protein
LGEISDKREKSEQGREKDTPENPGGARIRIFLLVVVFGQAFIYN